MAKAMEESFKVCGLCSQLVDESVEITNNMRTFLCGFLGIAEKTLPSKICLECYQRAMECRSFKDRCDKAIHKLHKSALYSSMILGGTPSEIAAAAKRSEKEDEALARAEMRTNAELDIVAPSQPPAAIHNARSKPGKIKPKPASKRELDSLGTPKVDVSVPRSTRSQKEPETPPQPSQRTTRGNAPTPVAPVPAKKPTPKRGKGVVENLPSVFIRRTDRSRAEKALEKHGAPAPAPDSAPDSGENNRKRKMIDDEDAPVGKRQRRETAATTKTTSSGRVVKAKKRDLSFDEVREVPPTPTRRQAAVVAKKSTVETVEKAKKKTTPKPAPKSKKAVPPPPPPPEPIVLSDDDDDDMKEIFPTVGPYQCEICQKITDTKQEFVDHIKKFHIDVVDEEVLRSLESDLRKSRKKAEIEAKKNGPKMTPKSTPKTPVSAKKPGSASKKSAKAATGPKSSPRKKLSKTQQKKLNASIEDRTCKICDSVISSSTRSDHERHRQTRYCQKIAAEKGIVQEDPLASPGKKGAGIEETADELAQRTCQFCGKVLSRKSDLSGHYKTKTCIAKQYEREAQQEMIANGGLPKVQMNNIENPEQVVSNTPVIMENAEVDTGYAGDESKGIAPADSPPSLPTSTTNEEKITTITKTEPSPVKITNNQPDSILEEQTQFMATSTSVDPPQGDWLGGPITTIADTLSPAPQQCLDPLVANGQPDPDMLPTPTEILGGEASNGGLITPTN